MILALALTGTAAHGQTAPPTTTPPAAAPLPEETYLLGRSYRVETMKGTTFTGTLVSMSIDKLEFDAQEMGRISLERNQIRRADLQGPATAGVGNKPGYFDIGNGNRLFFAPTGRGLRKGENSLQAVTLYLIGGNFGITDKISLGGYVSVIPGLSISDQLLVLTPKISFPVSEKVHVGAGVLYVRIPDFGGGSGYTYGSGNSGSYGAGIVYGAATYGSVDNNVTAGLGYGFFEGEVGSTPILQFGGQKRVSRRVSLISENYIIADSKAGMGGLYGIKINWRRTSLGLGAAYLATFPHDRTESYTEYNGSQYVTTTRTYRQGGDFFTSYIIPLYYDFTFRFGKGVK
ncbi:hypothetical protein BEN48_05740 [Hymenobacter glacialis]|uniref:Uncharacterized protein n=1 Tax=Hymenobacter glacialis TaxID=1908236 RepID=A0A1G1SSY5_9BACT|nr:hypothetical protein BEN48_05740 [Hymenobacter glacialis]